MSDKAKAVRTLRILVVDDEPSVREVLVEYLQGKGFDAQGAADGEEALRRMPEFRPDLVFLDLILPGLSGIEILQRIKALGRETRVIAVSGIDDVETARRALTLGASEYLTKPVDFTYLDQVLAIYTLLGQAERESR